MPPDIPHVLSATMEAHQAPPKAPVGLKVNDICNSEDTHRDSAYFSSDASSKHTSAASFGVSVLSPGSGFHSSPADKTPSPTTTNLLPQPLVSPSASNMSVASIMSPTTPGSMDARRFDRPTSLDSAPNSASLAGVDAEPLSRRESVDSRINQGFNDMRLGSSPYTSHNQSTASIQNALNQRNPRPGLENLSVHRISNGYQPSTERNPESHVKVVKTAPTITGPTTSTIARAAEPTKGQAWAFPEEEIHRIGPNGGTFLDSRRSSVTDSLASSQFTSESRLPPGQRRLEDGTDFNRLSSTSAEFPPVHHHSLQHKQLGDIQSDDGRSHTGSQPYSRTPELRQSHKLAERKRRTEMKELFDQLRDLMPQERGSKASKWEILTKAISEYQRQNDHIRILQNHCNTTTSETEMLRREIHNLRLENNQLRTELTSGSGQPANHPPPIPTQPPVFSSDPFANSSRTELPPLRSIGGALPNGPESMTGVQYEPPRPNGFRTETRF